METNNHLSSISGSMYDRMIFLFQNKSMNQIPIHEFATLSHLIRVFLILMRNCRFCGNSPTHCFMKGLSCRQYFLSFHFLPFFLFFSPLLLFTFYFYLFLFLQLPLCHMEVLWIGDKLELGLQA